MRVFQDLTEQAASSILVGRAGYKGTVVKFTEHGEGSRLPNHVEVVLNEDQLKELVVQIGGILADGE